MNIRYKNLLSPIRVGGVLLKNRMVSTTGIPHMLQGLEKYPTEKIITHIANRAKDGAAAIHLGHITSLHKPGGAGPGGPDEGKMSLSFMGHDVCNAFDLTYNGSHAYVCQLIDNIRYYGSIAVSSPMGHYTETRDPGSGPRPGFEVDDPEEQLLLEQQNCLAKPVDHITKQQIREFIDSTVESARILKLFGIEMFSIHNAYHNGLIANFWSADANHRTDEYGGSVKNRARLLLDTYDALRQTYGKNFPLECLVSAEGPGVSIPDTIELAKMSEGLIDILHIRHGYKDPQHPVGYTSTRENPCPNLAAAAAIKKSVMDRGGKILVAVSAGLQEPDFCEKILADQKADIIAMCRTFIADTDYGTKLYEGRGEDVVPCIRCNKCHVPNDSDKFRSFCSVNPVIGLEEKLDLMIAPVTRVKKVAVVGGGPAGMEAAIIAAGRGHNVTLYEKRSVLGGQLTHADYPAFKWPLADFKNYLIRQVYKAGVVVILNTGATRELLEQEGYDEVVVAIGPSFTRPHVPGIEGANTLMAFDVYGIEKTLPKNIAVIGGSETGTETGMYLAETGHSVTVMTRQKMLASDAAHAHYVVMMMEAYKAMKDFHYVRNIKKYVEIDKTGVTYIDKDDHEQKVTAELVVIAAGAEGKPEESATFYGVSTRTHYIGDCYRVGDVHKAVAAGFAAANQI